eukprot:GHRQ01021157.1.p1 GENE.GHRQ01021157.1~~GHRQ01021157.1.p1  ORF type:complete len:147 (-),score=47.27 GHRQ01021157.1:75-515(-)
MDSSCYSVYGAMPQQSFGSGNISCLWAGAVADAVVAASHHALGVMQSHHARAAAVSGSVFQDGCCASLLDGSTKVTSDSGVVLTVLCAVCPLHGRADYVKRYASSGCSGASSSKASDDGSDDKMDDDGQQDDSDDDFLTSSEEEEA